jgi:hypothetical protein
MRCQARIHNDDAGPGESSIKQCSRHAKWVHRTGTLAVCTTHASYGGNVKPWFQPIGETP